MVEVVYRNSAKEFTLGEAVQLYEEGIAIAVNDGRDITVIIEEE